MAWWHTLCAEGGDQFGGGTKTFPWNKGANAVEIAKQKADAGFEIMQKLGIPYFCFHDVDLVSEGASVEEYEANLKAITDYLAERQPGGGDRRRQRGHGRGPVREAPGSRGDHRLPPERKGNAGPGGRGSSREGRGHHL